MGRAAVSKTWTLRPVKFRVNLTLTKYYFPPQAASWKVAIPKTRKGGFAQGNMKCSETGWIKEGSLALCLWQEQAKVYTWEGWSTPLYIYQLWNAYIIQPGEIKCKEADFTCCYIIFLTKMELFTHIFISHECTAQCLSAAREMMAGVPLVKMSLPHGYSQASALPWCCCPFHLFQHSYMLTSSPANAMRGRLLCSSFYLAVVQNFPLFLLILHHSGSTQQLTLDFASHQPTWKQLLVFNGSTCVCWC